MTTLAYSQFEVHLKAKKLAPIYLIASDVTLLQQEARDLIWETAKNLGFERETHHVEMGFCWEAFFFNLKNFSLFSNQTYLEIHNPNAKFDESALRALLDYLKNPIREKVIILLTDKLTSAQQKTRWYKAIESAGICLNLRPIPAQELPNWIAERARKRGLTLQRDSVKLLSDLTEGNLLATQQALMKLGLLYPKTPITPEMLKPAITDNARFNVFELGQGLLLGQPKPALRILQKLKQTGTETTLILWALTRELREVAQLLFELQNGARETQILEQQWQQRRAPLKQALRRLSLPKISECLAFAENIDHTIKGLAPGNTWDKLEQLVLKITT